jgi:hypothetical protein
VFKTHKTHTTERYKPFFQKTMILPINGTSAGWTRELREASWIRALFEKLIFPLLVKKCPALYRSRY